MTPTVVVPIGSWEDRWREQFARVAEQARELGGEAVLVDARPADRRVPDLRSVVPAVGTTVVRLPGRTAPAAARNAGAAAGYGELLCFCDADDLVAPGWVAAMVRAAAPATLLGGVCEHRLLNAGWWHAPERLHARISLMDVHRHRPFFQSCNLALRRADFDRLGGFCETFGSAAGEDVDLCWRAQRAGMSLRVVDEAVLHYRLREDFTSSVRQAYVYGRSDAILARLHRHDGMPPHDPAGAVRDLARAVASAARHPGRPSAYADVARTAATWAGRLLGDPSRRQGDGR